MQKLFRSTWLPELVARIFAERPSEWIWQWADKDNVFLDSTMAAEPGYYRSAKTPWARRLQELCQHPFHRGRRIRKIVVKKCSQSGFTEAVLNVIRWFAKHWPRNVIYSIDTAEEAENIRNRLVRTLDKLGEEIFTGEKDDMGKLKLVLRHMIVWFYGSFAEGKFANKQAPFGVVDEAEQHKNGTRSVGDVESRCKTSDYGMIVVISKPEEKGGVIDKEHAQGNQEIYLVPCPFCGTCQELTPEKLVFDHCKNIFGEWDLNRVLNETAVRCESNGIDEEGNAICGKLIPESYKPWMIERGIWFATHDGDPEVISQEINDLYSLHESVSWGNLAKKIIQTARDREARKIVWTHNFARVWVEQAARPTEMEVLRCVAGYRRSQVMRPPLAILVGSDVGGKYAKWVAGAMLDREEKTSAGLIHVHDLQIVDWGNEIHPDAIAHIVAEARFRCRTDEKNYEVMEGAIDAKHRADDVFAACMRVPQKLWPIAGGGGRLWRKSLGLAPVGGPKVYPPWLRMISFNDRDFKSELYLTRIKRDIPPGVPAEQRDEFLRTMPRLILPEGLMPKSDLVQELIHEHLEEDPETDEMKWGRHGPNHYADCIKAILVLWRWKTRGGITYDTVEPEAEKEKEE